MEHRVRAALYRSFPAGKGTRLTNGRVDFLSSFIVVFVSADIVAPVEKESKDAQKVFICICKDMIHKQVIALMCQQTFVLVV